MLAPLPPDHHTEVQGMLRREAQRTHLRALLTTPTDQEHLEQLIAEHAEDDAFWTDVDSMVATEGYDEDAGAAMCRFMEAWANNTRDTWFRYHMLNLDIL